MLKYHTIDTPTVTTSDKNKNNNNNINININININNNINNNKEQQQNQLTHLETAKQRKPTRKSNAIGSATNVRPKRKSRTLSIIR
nr:probable serine/threonine-protein kinase DDB_G0277165 [Drosophila virilis]